MKKQPTLKETRIKIPPCVFLFCILINLSISSVLAGNRDAQSTTLTIRMNNKSMQEVFHYIEKNSEFIFVYLDNVIDSRQTVDVNAYRQPVTAILDQLFKDTDLTYQIDDRQILVRKKEARKASALPTVQQAIPIIGLVQDDTGKPVIGANILVKGTSNGTITDLDGHFTLQIPQTNALLVVSYIGYVSQEVAVGDRRSFTITLHASTEDIGEVVVTALGIKRETKALGYSVQEVKGESLTEARETNVLNSLSGKLAGVQISRSGNGEGGSSRIVIRGNNSIAGNNEPLVVVDGIPVNNFNGGTAQIDQWGGSDGGNGLSDINPDDIESISVLKGAAAAALYGARAGNGVLMITTKKGSKAKGLGITLNSNVMMETPLVKPKMQNLYGQGTNGIFDANSNYSWGAKMEGQLLKDWTGRERPYSPSDNDITDFLGTGVTTTHTLEANAVNDKISFRGTLSYQRMDGIIPTNYQDKYIMNLRTTVNLSKKLSLDAKVNYVKQRGWNRPQLTGSPENVMANYLMMPRSVHYSDLAGGVDEQGIVKRWTTDEANYVLNPYYTTAFNKNNNQRDRFIGFLALQYAPTSWLTVKLRHGEDMYWEKGDWRHASGIPYGKYNGKGDYGLNTSDFRERNTDALITAAKDNWWESGFSGSVSVGGNLMFQQNNTYAMSTGLLAIPDFFAISNGETPTPSNRIAKKSVNSVYGFARLSYGNWIFLDVTARNDWSSTLPSRNRSFFYPSAGLGWVISDMLRAYGVNLPQELSLAKIRASYAEVGNDTDPYRLLTTYGIYTVIGDIKGASTAGTIPLADLKPELIKSVEAGFDVRFFTNRLGLDVTWYKKNATNQILALPISSTTGKSSRMINAGNIHNNGIEIMLNGTPVRTKNFEWYISVNYSKNTNKIKELHPDSKRFILANTDFVNIVATEGSTYGDLYGRAYQRDEQGRKIVDENGLPLLESDMNTKIGNYLPKWTGSMIHSFTYKNISLSFMLDMRYGGDIFVNSLARGSQYGTTEMSLAGRAEWYAGTGGIVVEGVTTEGKPNTVAANPQAYWDRVARAGEEFVYDGTNRRAQSSPTFRLLESGEFAEGRRRTQSNDRFLRRRRPLGPGRAGPVGMPEKTGRTYHLPAF